MSKDKSDSNYLNQVKNHQKDKDRRNVENVRGDTIVDDVRFKSKQPKKDQELFVSKANKPAVYKKNPNFFNKLIFRFTKDNTTGMAAQLAYYFMLAIFPLMIFTLTLVPLFNINQQTVIDMVEEYVPADQAGTITGILENVLQGSGGGLLSFGLILTLWSASNGMNALMNAFNVAYDVEDNRNFIVARLLSILFTIILTVSIIIVFVLIVFGGQIGDLMFGVVGLDEEFQTVWTLVRSILPLLLVFVVFLIIYVFAPNVKVKIASTLAGTAFTTIAFLGASWGFSFYVSNFADYNATYGSLAGAIILMFWLFITGVIIIVGAQINSIVYQNMVEKQAVKETDENESIGEQNMAKKNI